MYVITKSVWGGAQRYVYDLATNLPKDKFEAVVVTGGDGPLIDRLAKQKIRVINLPEVTKNINFWQELKSLFYLGKIFAREKPDILHLSSSKFGGLGALAGRIVALFTGRPKLVIFTAHGWPFNEDRNFLARYLTYFFSWLTAFFTDRTINIAKADYKQSLKFPLLPNSKFIYIPNGLGLNDQSFLPPAEARKILGLEEKQFSIGTIAELTKNKGLIYLIDAINLIRSGIKNLKLKVIIIGEGEDREKIQNRLGSLGLQEIIYPVGFRQDAGKYLKGFDVFVLPSIKEGLPYALMEAMAAGLPIIASDVGGVPDLIEHGRNGLLVKTKDSANLAETLNKLIKNQEIRLALGRKAKIKIETNFQLRDMLTKTITLYDSTQ